MNIRVNVAVGFLSLSLSLVSTCVGQCLIYQEIKRGGDWD